MKVYVFTWDGKFRSVFGSLDAALRAEGRDWFRDSGWLPDGADGWARSVANKRERDQQLRVESYEVEA